MTCQDYDRMMLMELAGDATSEERERLRRHIDTCARCAAEWASVSSFGDYTRRLAALRPVAADPESLTRSILTNVGSVKESGNVGWVDGLLELFGQPAVRIAAIAFVTLCVMGYGVIDVVHLQQIHILETRFAHHSQASGRVELSYALHPADHVRYASLPLLLPALSLGGVSWNDGAVVVRRNLIRSLPWLSEESIRLLFPTLIPPEHRADLSGATLDQLQRTATVRFTVYP